MSSKKIFWLDDAPAFLQTWHIHNIDLSFLDCVSFAHDYEQGAELVRKEDWDLIVLDGDFVRRGSDSWRGDVKSYVEAAREKDESALEMLNGSIWDASRFDAQEGYDSMFAEFYDNFLQSQKEKVVVFSASTLNFAPSIVRDLPFYLKRFPKDKEEVISELGEFFEKEYRFTMTHRHHNADFQRDSERLSSGEYPLGSDRHLLQERLGIE